jgi:hypothetical protein
MEAFCKERNHMSLKVTSGDDALGEKKETLRPEGLVPRKSEAAVHRRQQRLQSTTHRP